MIGDVSIRWKNDREFVFSEKSISVFFKQSFLKWLKQKLTQSFFLKRLGWSFFQKLKSLKAFEKSWGPQSF